MKRDKIREGLQITGEPLCAKLRDLPPEKLQEELDASAFPVPVEERTVRTLMTLLLVHEGYHAGQLGLLRPSAGERRCNQVRDREYGEGLGTRGGSASRRRRPLPGYPGYGRGRPREGG